MPIVLHLWSIAARMPRLFRGAWLHRAGLEALGLGDPPLADRLFEAAASRYRHEMRVEALARLRVHQRIARWRLDSEPEAMLEIEHLLASLDRIECLEPPFEMMRADVVLARWLEDAAARCESPRRAA